MTPAIVNITPDLLDQNTIFGWVMSGFLLKDPM